MDNLSIALLSGLVGAIVGAIVGGICSVYGTYYFNKKYQKELDSTQKERLIKALNIELQTLLDTYMELVGNKIEKAITDNDFILTGFVKHYTHYFITYDNSTNQLRLLNDNLAERVTVTYIHLKAFFDELTHYGELSQRYDESSPSFNQLEQRVRRDPLEPSVTGFFDYLKARHVQVKNQIEATTKLLSNEQNHHQGRSRP